MIELVSEVRRLQKAHNKLHGEVAELQAQAAAMRAWIRQVPFLMPWKDFPDDAPDVCDKFLDSVGDAGRELLRWAKLGASFCRSMNDGGPRLIEEPPEWLNNPRKADEAAS